MGGTIIWIIIVIAVVWQIISAIITQAQEKRKEAESRRRLSEQAESRSGTAQASTAASPGRGARLDDLAARRQAQLEELRRRRALQQGRAAPTAPRTSQPIPTSRTGSPAPVPVPTSQRRSGPSQRQVARPSTQVSPGDRQRQMSQQSEVRRQQEREAKLTREQAVYDKRAEQLLIPRRRDKQRRPAEPAPIEQVALGTPVQKTEIGEQEVAASEAVQRRIQRVRAQLSNPTNLRDLFVLKELIDPPLGLREMRI